MRQQLVDCVSIRSDRAHRRHQATICASASKPQMSTAFDNSMHAVVVKMLARCLPACVLSSLIKPDQAKPRSRSKLSHNVIGGTVAERIRQPRQHLVPSYSGFPYGEITCVWTGSSCDALPYIHAMSQQPDFLASMWKAAWSAVPHSFCADIRSFWGDAMSGDFGYGNKGITPRK
ncbi:hypothetical protein WJX79_005123 [Trebouxia sp. C0005]